jgi:hypothetical protein
MALQYTESNLIGYLNSGIDTVNTTITVKFYDKISGVSRTPLATTLLFVIDKGSSAVPNSNYEIILAGSHSTLAGVTTMINCVRGLAFTGVSLAAGTGTSHVANAEIGTADVHYLWNLIVNKLNGTEAIGAALNFDIRSVFSGAGISSDRVFADATARDAAITAPLNGDRCYNTAVGLPQKYVAGAWIDDTAGGAVPNAEEGTAGKVELATVAQQGTATDAGVSGAHLVPQNKNLVKTSSGAGDESKIPILDAAGRLATGFHKAELVTGLDASPLHYHTIAVIQGTRDLSGVNGAVNYAHGLGAAPRNIEVTAVACLTGGWAGADYNPAPHSIGFSDGTVNKCTTHGNDCRDGISVAHGGVGNDASNVVNISTADATAAKFKTQTAVATFDATNVTLTWTLTSTGTPTQTGTIYFTIKVQA